MCHISSTFWYVFRMCFLQSSWWAFLGPDWASTRSLFHRWHLIRAQSPIHHIPAERQQSEPFVWVIRQSKRIIQIHGTRLIWSPRPTSGLISTYLFLLNVSIFVWVRAPWEWGCFYCLSCMYLMVITMQRTRRGIESCLRPQANIGYWKSNHWTLTTLCQVLTVARQHLGLSWASDRRRTVIPKWTVVWSAVIRHS